MGVKQVARYKFTRVISLLLTRFTIEKASQVAVWPFLNKQIYSFVTPLFTWNHQTLLHFLYFPRTTFSSLVPVQARLCWKRSSIRMVFFWQLQDALPLARHVQMFPKAVRLLWGS